VIPSSSLFDPRRSHRAISRATVNGIALDVTAGTVTKDATAAVRARCDVELVMPATPTFGPADLINIYGAEITISRGLVLPDGREELIPLGVFRVEDFGTDGDTLKVSGLDRSARIIDARIESAYSIAKGTNLGTALSNLILDGWPDLEIDLPATTATSPGNLLEEQADRWEAALEIARSLGWRLFFDHLGRLVARQITLDGGAVADLVDGVDGNLVDASRKESREGVYNRVITTGENPALAGGVAPRGVATDDNPASPTFYYGSFGRRPRWYASPFIATSTQAQAAAEGMLADATGASKSISFGSLVDPRLEPDDVVLIHRAELGLQEEATIETLTIPLDAGGTMTGTTRSTAVIPE